MPATHRARLGALSRLVLAVALTTHAAFFPWFPELRPPNELSRIYLAESLVEDGSVSIDGPIDRHGLIFDVSAREVDGRRRYFSDKAPGVALVSLPAIALHLALTPDPALAKDPAAARAEALATRVRLARLFSATLPTLVLIFLLLRFLEEELSSPALPPLIALAYAMGTVATPYAFMTIGHQLSALVLFGLFLRVRATSRDSTSRSLLWTGALAGSALLVEYQNALLVLPFTVWFLAKTRASWRALGLTALGALAPVGLLMAYHTAAFGAPWLTGYSFIASSFAEVHAQGLMGVALPKASHAALSFLSPTKGLFFWSPWLILAVPGLFVLERRGDHRFLRLFAILYALFVSAMVYPDGGWTVSQRHLAPMVPFLLLPIGLVLERVATWRGRLTAVVFRSVFAALVLCSILFCTVSAVVWPHYQETLRNPFWQLGWPLFADGWVPASALSFMSSWWLLVGLLALAAVIVVGWLVAPWVRARRTGALVSGLVVLGAATWGWLSLSQLPAKGRGAHAERSFAERVYVPDPRSEPTP